MASDFLKMKGLLARKGESLQLRWGFASLCFYSRLNSWQVSQVLAVELAKSAQLPERGIAKHQNCRGISLKTVVDYVHKRKKKTACTVFLAQTPQKGLGIALKFHNYTISEKNIKGCERGWWKINEHM